MFQRKKADFFAPMPPEPQGAWTYLNILGGKDSKEILNFEGRKSLGMPMLY
jgi:hypothetical protein